MSNVQAADSLKIAIYGGTGNIGQRIVAIRLPMTQENSSSESPYPVLRQLPVYGVKILGHGVKIRLNPRT